MDDLTLTLKKPAVKLSGWQAVRVTRGIERMPSDFDIEFTERFPGEAESVVVKPGDECQVLIGSDLVITGYVDRFMPTIDRSRHSLRVTGRSKCQDLVDCSVVWDSNQMSGATALTVAQNLAGKYNITVKALTDVGDPIKQVNFIWSETPYQVIERVVRSQALLVYDSPDGNLILSRVGTEKHGSGFQQGKNVERATAMFGMDLRYSEYRVRMHNMTPLSETGDAGDILTIVEDKDVPRFRRREIIAETGVLVAGLAQKRGVWEAARRAGRSYCVQLTTDSWRDGDGMLWTPNRMVRLQLPSLKIPDVQWIVAEVTYRRDRAGTAADLVLMPPDAFSVQPIVLNPIPADVQTRG
ncbi:hypothetical protein JHL17_34120 [Azospirillum sp. YIM B02556]|uniref:Mu-like prophage tail protein gpP n=1 Tax=Azospirillum endophyticum TaxID=2800326 RepID=A0ABS1FGD4_9PROT|nr:hypothetical protein [Azospirillum endophyticum]MBK1842444.1 hypothetical protein [Azospirillum endophyticum]